MVETRAIMRGNPGDAARKRGLNRVLIPILGIGILFGFAAGILLGDTGILPWWVGGIIFLFAFICLFIFKQQQPSLVYGFFKGARGEEMVASELSRLPATWTIFNGVILPDKTDIDHIAIGPQGVFVIETKHWLGDVAIEAGQLLVDGVPARHSPIAQVRTHTAAITDFLQLRHPTVSGILCFAGPQFKAAPQHLDEVCITSYIDLLRQIAERPVVLNATEIATYVTSLGTLSITQSL